MTPDEILAITPRYLTQKQREQYFEDGFVLLERIIPLEWIERLRAVTDQMIDESRLITRRDTKWDIEPDHSYSQPRLRRLSSPTDHHALYWAYASAPDSPLPDIVADLVGPDVKFHHSKLNFKWSRGGAEVKWHQDIPAWPHTNYTPCTVGTYLYDCDREQGPMGFVRGSHNGPIYSEYDNQGRWVGCLSQEDGATIDMSKVVYLEAPAGSLTIHNCRSLHYSQPNHSPVARPLLLYVYSNSNAMPYSANPIPSKHSGTIVRGHPAKWAYHDPRPCLLPPDWAALGYSSLFAKQQGDDVGVAPGAGGMM